MLVLAVAEYLNKLFQDCSLTAVALLRKTGRVVVMTVHFAFVLIVTVLSAEDGGADGTSEVLNVVLAIQGCYIGTAQGIAAGVAEEVESAKVVSLAEGVLIWTLLGIREELGGNSFAAILSIG